MSFLVMVRDAGPETIGMERAGLRRRLGCPRDSTRGVLGNLPGYRIAMKRETRRTEGRADSHIRSNLHNFVVDAGITTEIEGDC
jgi:hypothetical protein